MVDYSVLIAALTPSAAHHERAVLALKEARSHRGARAGREFEHDIMAVGRVEPATHEVGSLAARLRAQRQVKLPDALVLATGIHLRAAEVLTFDERWRSLDRRVRCLA